MSKNVERTLFASVVIILTAVLYWTFPVNVDPAAPGKPLNHGQAQPLYEIGPYVEQKQRPPFVPYKNKLGQLMSSTGPNSPGTAANDASFGSDMWGTTGNILALDGSYSVLLSLGAGNSQYLKATNFGFSIAADQIIDGIEVKWYRKTSSGAATDGRVRIVKGGSIGSTELGAGATWNSGSIAVQTFGGPTDLCGETWLYSDINDSTFGAVISAAYAGSTSCEVDHVTITVYHHTSIVDGVGTMTNPSTTWLVMIRKSL